MATEEALLFPASFAQRRLWLTEQLLPGTEIHNVPGVVQIEGELDVVVLEKSLLEIMRRHEGLRTRFITVQEEPWQVIDEQPDIKLDQVSLADVPEQEREAMLHRLAVAERRRVFDLEKGPLLRLKLVQVTQRRHVLLLTMHHIICDGWSIGIFLRELSLLYEAFSAGQPSPLPELPIQYADFSVWQHENRRDGVLAKQLQYWTTQLKGVETLDLLTDYARPASSDQSGASLPFLLPTGLTDKLKSLSRQRGATLYMTLLAAFQALLSRYTGQQDVAVGTPVAGRTRRELEGIIGFFVNTLVIRSQVTGRSVDLLDQVRDLALAAYANQDVPFDVLVEQLSPQRNAGRTPLFQVMYTFHNTPVEELKLGATVLKPLNVESGISKFDLAISIGESGTELYGHLSYKTSLFERETISRMAGHYHSLLSGMAADPATLVSLLPLLAASEKTQLLSEWSRAEKRYFPAKCVHEAFEETVKQHPEKFCVVSEGAQLTFLEVNQQANRLARLLRQLGIGPETSVGILLESSPEMVVAVLAILKAGGSYLPIDPAFPLDRMQYVLEDSRTMVLLTQKPLSERLHGLNLSTIYLDEIGNALAGHEDSDFASGAVPENRIYTIYTSGSTGRPKGVMVEHRQVINYLRAITERFELEPGAHYAMVQPLAVDACITALLPPLCLGGTLHLIPRSQAIDSKIVLEAFRGNPVDVLKIAPSHLMTLLEAAPTSDLLPRRMLVMGGEPTEWEWYKKILAPLLPSTCRVFLQYGPTETTVAVLALEAGLQATLRGSTIPLGSPFANMHTYVLDQEMQPVPAGVRGEIYIGGECVARGYLHRPDLTAERFIPDCFSAEPGKRLYQTGDLARWLPEGIVEFLGRKDSQLKIRGFRIELGEIDATLRQHPAVEKALTIAQDAAAGSRQLVSYVVLRSDRMGQALTQPADNSHVSADVRQFLKERLPDYMVPAAVAILDDIPLSAHGKVDLQALPKPALESKPGCQVVAPRNLLETQLVEIWEEVLNVSPVSVDDDFFRIGGHSLLALRMMAMVHNRLQRSVPVANLLQNATLSHLAALLAQPADERTERALLVKIQPQGPGIPLFCMHPTGGEVTCYVPLAREMGKQRPVYGLQSPPFGTLREPATLEEMASLYLKAIRREHARGPYALAGWSSGGLVAFEMARQLNEMGDDAALVVLIDTHPPYDRRRLQSAKLPALTRFALDLAQLLGKDPEPFRERFLRLQADEQENLIYEELVREQVLPQGISSEKTSEMARIFDQNSQAVNRYVLQPVPQAVVLFRATESEEPEQLARDWQQWTRGGVKLVMVSGNHYTMLTRENAATIAGALEDCLKALDTQWARARMSPG